MKIIGNTDSNFLHNTRITFNNIQKIAAISTALEALGYDAARIQVGVGLHGTAETAFRTMVQARLNRGSKMAEVQAKYRQINTRYMGHVNRLRKEFIDEPETMSLFGFKGPRQRTVAGFIEQVTNFYSTAIDNPIALQKLQGQGYTSEGLQADRDDLLLYQSMRSEYQEVAGYCQEMGVERSKAIKTLRRWVRALNETCKVAFADNPQIMEKIKFFVRNSPKPKTVKPTTDTGETDNDTGTATENDGTGTTETGETGTST